MNDFFNNGIFPHTIKSVVESRPITAARMKVAQHRVDFGQSVFMIRLRERHLAFGIGVVSQHMWNLFQNQDDTNRRQQTFDHAAGKKRGERTGSHESQANLDQPPIITANRNVSNDPSAATCAATITVRPAAGPLTLVCD